MTVRRVSRLEAETSSGPGSRRFKDSTETNMKRITMNEWRANASLWPMKSSAKGLANGVRRDAQEKKAHTIGKANMPWYNVRSRPRGLVSSDRE